MDAQQADLEQIHRLKYRYVRTLDTKAWDEFADCLTEDVVGNYGGLDLDGREALVDYMRSHMTEGMITLHQLHNPEITLDGDRATGIWYLQDKVILPAYRFVLEGAAFYEDRYRRTEDGWRIEATGYQRTYEMTWSMDDVPSLKVKDRPTH